LIKTIQLN